MYRKFFALLSFGLFPIFIFSQDINKAKLDSLFQVLEANNKFMGSVAVSKNGALVYANAIGYADLESGKKSNQNTIYRIGSVTKTFTAALVMKAVEEKKLKLDQTINKYLPEIPHADQITISHLLYHRSGVHNFTDNEDYLSWNTQPKTEKEMVDIIANGGSDFTPDSVYSYSNSNYVLLSFILADVYKKSYAQLLEEKITKPLGLHSTYFGGKIDLSKNECNSYMYSTEWSKSTETDMSIAMGAGAIVSTPSDLIRYQEALFTGKLLSEESFAQMTTAIEGIGMGLFPLNFYSTAGYGHTGGIDGFNALVSYFSVDSVSFALVSNGANYNPNDVAIAVLSGVYGLKFDIPVFKQMSLTPEDLEIYLGVYSSPDLPIKITITRNDTVLMAQGTGQPAFALEASDTHIFRYDQAGLVMEFLPDSHQLMINQGGGIYFFTKE